MKKKFFAIYALVGAMVASPVFTSCVDDEESASVTALRQAKAEQLAAMAELSKAQAEAALITANAEAAYKNALAAYQQALANAKEAEQQRLAEQYAITLEVIKAEAEADLLRAQLEISNLEDQLLNKANNELKNLYYEYSNAVGNTTWIQQNIINVKNQLAQAEAGLVTAEESAKMTIANYEDQIAYQQKLIALYEEYNGADIEALKTARAEALIVYKKAQDNVKVKSVARNEARTAYEDALYVKKYWDEYSYSNYSVLSIWDVEEVGEKALATVKAARTLRNINWNLVDAEEKVLTEASNISYEYYTLNEAKAEVVKLEKEGYVKNHENTIGKAAEGETEATGLYADLAAVEKAKADVLAADEDADVSNYDLQIANIKADIERVKGYLADEQAALDEFNAAVASFSGEDLAAYDKAIADIVALVEAYDKADAEFQAAGDEQTNAWAEYYALGSLLNQNDAAQAIKNCEAAILDYQQEIQYVNNNLSNSEAQIEQLKVNLANLEAQLAAQQAVIDSIKAEIDALLASDEETAE